MASAPIEILRNISLVVDGRVCGFGIIEPFVLDNINKLNIEIREGMALKNDAQLSNILQPPSRSAKVFKFQPTSKIPGKQNQEKVSSVTEGIQLDSSTKQRSSERSSSGVQQPCSSNTNNHSVGAGKRKDRDKPSGAAGGKNEQNSQKISENNHGQFWTKDFEKYIQHSSTPKVVLNSKQSIQTNLESINRKKQIPGAEKPKLTRTNLSSTKENCSPYEPSSLASTKIKGTYERPATSLISTEKGTTCTPRKRRSSSCLEPSKMKGTPKAKDPRSSTELKVTPKEPKNTEKDTSINTGSSGLINTVKGKQCTPRRPKSSSSTEKGTSSRPGSSLLSTEKGSASTPSRPGSSLASTEIGSTPSFSLTTTEKITLRGPGSEKVLTCTPKRPSSNLSSTERKSTPQVHSFASTEEKKTTCTPRTRKSSSCSEKRKKGTPCTPARTSPRFSSAGKIQTVQTPKRKKTSEEPVKTQKRKKSSDCDKRQQGENNETDPKISQRQEKKKKLSGIDDNKVDTTSLPGRKKGSPSEDKKTDRKNDLLDIDDIIFVSDSPEFDLDQSSQDEGQIGLEMQHKEGQGVMLTKHGEDLFDPSSNSDSNDAVAITDNKGDYTFDANSAENVAESEDDAILNQDKKKVVKSTVGFFIPASKSNTPSPLKEN